MRKSGFVVGIPYHLGKGGGNGFSMLKSYVWEQPMSETIGVGVAPSSQSFAVPDFSSVQ